MKGKLPSLPGSLSRQIFALAFVNLGLLLLVFLVFARYQYRLEFGSFLFAPARDRLEAVAAEVALDLEQTPVERRTELMGRFAAVYGVDFYLFKNEGTQLAGKPVQLPVEVRRRLEGPRPREEAVQPRGQGRGEGRGEGADGGPEDEGVPPRRRGPPPPDRRGPPPGVRGPTPGRRGPPPPPGQGGRVFEMPVGNLFWAGVRIPVEEPGQEGQVRGTLLLAATSFYGTPLFFDFKPWLAALIAVMGIFVVCWLPFIRGLTKTISRITEAAEQIEQGNFEMELPVDRSDELGHLATAINRMSARLSGFVSGQKRFLGDIAHELCAPIARMQFGLGILERKTDESQRAAVDDVQDEMRQMSGLVSELLSFSKAGMEKKDRPLGPVDVGEVARRAAEREGGSPAFHIEIPEPVTAIADAEYLLRSLGNLLRNALRYAGEAGPITVSARREKNEVVIAVTDCGPGLPPEELDRIFTPFYRLEASRNRDHGGVGLGLAIVKSCVEGCRGQVRCRNRQPSGLEVEIRLAAA